VVAQVDKQQTAVIAVAPAGQTDLLTNIGFAERRRCGNGNDAWKSWKTSSEVRIRECGEYPARAGFTRAKERGNRMVSSQTAGKLNKNNESVTERTDRPLVVAVRALALLDHDGRHAECPGPDREDPGAGLAPLTDLRNLQTGF
jgi:hypothetical protein